MIQTTVTIGPSAVLVVFTGTITDAAKRVSPTVKVSKVTLVSSQCMIA